MEVLNLLLVQAISILKGRSAALDPSQNLNRPNQQNRKNDCIFLNCSSAISAVRLQYIIRRRREDSTHKITSNFRSFFM